MQDRSADEADTHIGSGTNSRKGADDDDAKSCSQPSAGPQVANTFSFTVVLAVAKFLFLAVSWAGILGIALLHMICLATYARTMADVIIEDAKARLGSTDL